MKTFIEVTRLAALREENPATTLNDLETAGVQILHWDGVPHVALTDRIENADDIELFLNTRACAAITGLSRSAIYKWRDRDQVPHTENYTSRGEKDTYIPLHAVEEKIRRDARTYYTVEDFVAQFGATEGSIIRAQHPTAPTVRVEVGRQGRASVEEAVLCIERQHDGNYLMVQPWGPSKVSKSSIVRCQTPRDAYEVVVGEEIDDPDQYRIFENEDFAREWAQKRHEKKGVPVRVRGLRYTGAISEIGIPIIAYRTEVMQAGHTQPEEEV